MRPLRGMQREEKGDYQNDTQVRPVASVHEVHSNAAVATRHTPRWGSLQHDRLVITLAYTTLLSGAAGGVPLSNLIETELTQCRSLVAVKLSPSNTWPRWPPHALHMISTRFIPNEKSVSVLTDPV